MHLDKDSLQKVKWFINKFRDVELSKNNATIIEKGHIFIERVLRNHSELMHHGVKGQEWGIRNGPPYPLKKNRVAKSNEDGILDDIPIHRSVGARSLNYDVYDPISGKYYHFVEGTRIRNCKIFAGKGGVKPLKEEVAEGLTEQIGGKPENWQHCKGIGTLDYEGEDVDVEVHWFQEESVGKHKFIVKNRFW